MNTAIKDFLTPDEARNWAEYFAKELGQKISYDYYYDNYLETRYETQTKDGSRIIYPFMNGYKFGLTPKCKKDIAVCVTEKHELRFYLKQKGMSFLYIAKFEPDDKPVPIITSLEELKIGEYITL
jgi:hypothetical protein